MAPAPSPVARFFGYAMIAAGVLIALLSGACTLVFMTMYLQPHGDHGMVWLPLAIGAPFIAIGIALVAGGRSLSRRREPRTPAGEV